MDKLYAQGRGLTLKIKNEWQIQVPIDATVAHIIPIDATSYYHEYKVFLLKRMKLTGGFLVEKSYRRK